MDKEAIMAKAIRDYPPGTEFYIADLDPKERYLLVTVSSNFTWCGIWLDADVADRRSYNPVVWHKHEGWAKKKQPEDIDSYKIY